MPDAILSILIAAAVSAIGSLLITWANDGLDAARRSRRLDQLKATLESKKALDPKHAGHAILNAELTSLLEAIDRSNTARPYWRSFFQFLVGIIILAGAISPLYLLLFPQMISQPWVFLPIVIVLVVIYAIESRPKFLELFKRPVKRDSL